MVVETKQPLLTKREFITLTIVKAAAQTGLSLEVINSCADYADRLIERCAENDAKDKQK